MSSEPAGILRIRERLEKSWVVEGPITAMWRPCQRLCVVVQLDIGLPISSLSAPIKPAAASNPLP